MTVAIGSRGWTAIGTGIWAIAGTRGSEGRRIVQVEEDALDPDLHRGHRPSIEDSTVIEQGRFDSARFREDYQPHWFWAVMLILVPALLMVIGFLGLEIGSSIISPPLGAAAPRIALILSVAGMGAAFVRRRRAVIDIAAVGLILTGVGFSLLLWLST